MGQRQQHQWGVIALGMVMGMACMTARPLPADASPRKVEVVRRGQGAWELLVDGQSFFVQGVVFGFSVVGDDPDLGTLRDWSVLDLNNNGKNDIAYDSWVDKNGNNRQDPDEPAVGDWQLLKDLGANTIRIYQMPSADARVDGLYFYPGARLTFVHEPNKEIFRDLAGRYGILTIVGHFFGEWGIGSKALWENGTDYTDPDQRANLLDCVRVMVEEHKDEPYTLMWMLGNENFAPHDNDNAETEVEAFLSLVNEAAGLIHAMDPNHPVALCNWDLANLEEIARLCPAVDIYGLNSYRWTFSEVWKQAQEILDRPVLLTEYGFQAKQRYMYDEGSQARYHRDCWRDIADNRFGGPGRGNSIGGLVFSWCDQWFLGGDAAVHDSEDFAGVPGAEWYGITSQGDGTQSPYLRRLRKAYGIYQTLWNENGKK